MINSFFAKRVLKKFLYILIFVFSTLFLIIPFFIHKNEIFYANYLESLFTHVLIVGIALTVVGYSILNETKNIRLQWADVLLLGYVVYSVANCFLIVPQLGVLPKLKKLIFLGVLYFAYRIWFAGITREEKQHFFRSLFVVMLTIACAHCLAALLQILGFLGSLSPNSLVTGFFSTAVILGFFLGITFPIALGIYLTTEGKSVWDKIQKNLSLITCLVILFILPKTENRSSFIMSIVGAVLVCYFIYKNPIHDLLKRRLVKISFGIGVPLLIIASSFALYKYKPQSADGRLLIWKVISGKVMESPFWGQGFNSVQVRYTQWQKAYFEKGIGTTEEERLADQVSYSYNEFLEILVETGLIGFLLFFLFLGALIFQKKKKGDNARALQFIAASLLGLAACAMFSYPFPIPSVNVILFLFLAFLTNQIASEGILKFSISKISAIAVFILIGFWGGFYLVKEINKRSHYQDWHFAKQLFETHSYEDALPHYERLHSSMRNNFDFMVEYSRLLHNLDRNQEAAELIKDYKKIFNSPGIDLQLARVYAAMGKYDLAEKEFYSAYYAVPNRFVPLYLMAKMYEKSKNIAKMLEIAELILNKDVKVPSQAINDIKSEMQNMIESYKHGGN